MSEGIVIRRAETADLDTVENIENAAFDTDRFPRKELSYLISHSSGGCFIASCNGRACGYLSLLLRRGTRNVRIYSVAVNADCRGKGVGAALVKFAEDFARQNGRDRVSLEVRTDNSAAIALYEKNGFRKTATLAAYYHDGSDGYKMVKMLSAEQMSYSASSSSSNA